MSHLLEYEAFIEVARQGSFTKAADTLGLSRSRVSQLIQQLEARLDIRLLLRTTRKVTLTAEGEQFLQSCREGVNLLNRAEADLKVMTERLSGPIRINSVGGIVGETYLSEALASTVAEHPELSVTINYSSTLVDLNKDPVDLVLRIGHSPAENVESIFLGDIHHHLCASPSYVNRHGYPESPDDLLIQPTVCGTPKLWELEHSRTGRKHVLTPTPCWRSGNTYAQLIAAESGLGIARLLSLVAEPSLAAGRLVTVLPEWRVEPTSLWLMWRPQVDLPKRIEMVRDQLIQRLSERF